MPMLALTKISWPATRIGCARLLRIRRASLAASSGWLSPGMMTVNSSPPSRATSGAGAAGGPQAERHLLEQLVTRLVPQGVVDPAEVVEVDEEGGDQLTVPPRLLQGLSQPHIVREPIRKAGQAVVVSQGLDLLQHLRVRQG